MKPFIRIKRYSACLCSLKGRQEAHSIQNEFNKVAKHRCSCCSWLSLLKALARLFEGPFPPLIPMQPEECEEFRLLSFVERKEALILQMGEVWLQAWIDLLSMLDDR